MKQCSSPAMGFSRQIKPALPITTQHLKSFKHFTCHSNSQIKAMLSISNPQQIISLGCFNCLPSPSVPKDTAPRRNCKYLTFSASWHCAPAHRWVFVHADLCHATRRPEEQGSNIPGHTQFRICL